MFKNLTKEERAWVLYDVGNSAFTMLACSLIPIWFKSLAIGDGPVDAAYKAVDKIICPPPHELYDYAIHSISGGKDALGEVTVKLKVDGGSVTGRGLSTDIIEASIIAYINAVNRLLDENG